MEKMVRNTIENYLSKRIEKIWGICVKTGMKIPYTVEEAGFNSLLLASIDEYIGECEQDYSFAVSEAGIERSGKNGCRCDIIWYKEDDVCYFELKGSCYGSKKTETDIKNAIIVLNEAKKQLKEINYYENEKWYRIEPNNRYGCCLAMIQSIIKEDGKSNYNEIKEKLEGNNEINIFYMHRFCDEKLPMMTDGDKKYKNDGYFIIGNVDNMKNLK